MTGKIKEIQVKRTGLRVFFVTLCFLAGIVPCVLANPPGGGGGSSGGGSCTVDTCGGYSNWQQVRDCWCNYERCLQFVIYERRWHTTGLSCCATCGGCYVTEELEGVVVTCQECHGASCDNCGPSGEITEATRYYITKMECLAGCDPNWCMTCDGAGHCINRCDPNNCELCYDGNCIPVRVQKIQYYDRDAGWTDVSGTLYVYKGDSIKFKAIKSSDNVPWPSGKPVWGGSSGVSGTGEITAITFSTKSTSGADYKTVTAECCNTVTVNVIVCEVEVTDIKFNHDDPSPGHYAAINIKEDATHSISAPEWVKGGQNKPAAYLVNLNNIDIKARFGISPQVGPQTTILAQCSPGGALIGNLGEVSGITFNSGTSGYIRFTGTHQIYSNIYKETIQWQWKVKDFGNGSYHRQFNINTSGPHTIYVILDTPQPPQSEPWVGVLDISCQVASGRAVKDGAMFEIWDYLYFDSGGVYDTYMGQSHYYSQYTGKFTLTQFLTALYNSSIGTVNCYDMGKSMVIFSNALGCGAVCKYVDPFGYLNCIKPIGCGWTNNPFYGNTTQWDYRPIVEKDKGLIDHRSAFGNHMFSTSIDGIIYDASGGMVDIDSVPDYGPPFISRYLDGLDNWPSYESKVIDHTPSDLNSPGIPQDITFGVE